MKNISNILEGNITTRDDISEELTGNDMAYMNIYVFFNTFFLIFYRIKVRSLIYYHYHINY